MMITFMTRQPHSEQISFVISEFTSRFELIKVLWGHVFMNLLGGDS